MSFCLCVHMHPPPNSFFSFSLSYLACIAAFARSQVGFGGRVVQDRLGTWTELSTVGSWICHRKCKLSTQSNWQNKTVFSTFFSLALDTGVVFEKTPPTMTKTQNEFWNCMAWPERHFFGSLSSSPPPPPFCGFILTHLSLLHSREKKEEENKEKVCSPFPSSSWSWLASSLLPPSVGL